VNLFQEHIHPISNPRDPTLIGDRVEARKRIERFLFHAFSKRSRGGAEGRKGEKLNDKNAITPLAFLSLGQGRSQMYEIPDLKNMLLSHLNTEENIRTDFSSWAATLLLACRACCISSLRIAYSSATAMGR
jgi:hypothetical protein